jgi:peptidoglycan/xylan/chitin deacetylase (PgdA/CDA1 family)
MMDQVLGYHEVVTGSSDSSYSLSAGRFERQLKLVLQLRAESHRFIQITFDDGHGSNAEVAAPLLELAGLSATFFVTAGWIGAREGFMNWSQLSVLIDKGHKVQSHGLKHRFLTDLSDVELRTELMDSKSMLEDLLGREVSEISLPGGRFDTRVLATCAEVGYRRVYSSDPFSRGASPAGVDLQGRLIVNNRMNEQWLRRYLRGDRGPRLLMYAEHAIRKTAQAALGNGLYHNLWSVVSRRRGMNANAR